MNAEEILNSSLDDLVFENRNKNYGAYDLRKRYGSVILLSLLIGAGFYVLSFSTPYIISKFASMEKPAEKKKIAYTELSEPPPIDKNTPPPKLPDIPPPPKTIKFTPPEIKPDEEVKQEDVIPPVEQVQKTDPSTETNDVDPNATVDFNDVAPPVIEKKKEPFMYVEQMPTFPGGEKAMYDFLAKNIRYPPAAREANLEGKVTLMFVVNEDGEISDITLKRDGVGGGCAEEAIRVVKTMPKWTGWTP